jgi:phosphoenolpyruvate---glycerone phosphotransferase subunit DhaK
MAQEQHGLRVITVLGTDDVASAPPDEIHNRRGIAGAFFVIKAAAAKAETMADLDTVVATAQKANANTRTMGVALSSCTVPANGNPTFNLGDDEMEIGLGIHGEPGMRRSKLEPADKIVDTLVEAILADLDYSGSDVAVLVNGLGATPYEELYVLYRRVKQILDSRNINIKQKFVGEYVTSLEMAGASISLMRLDDELDALLHAPVNCPMFKHI